jgi:hypothetical protein
VRGAIDALHFVRTTTTDEAGALEFGGVGSGPHLVRATRNPWTFVDSHVEVPSAEKVLLRFVAEYP